MKLILLIVLCIFCQPIFSLGTSPPATPEDVTAIQNLVNQFFGIWSLGNCTLWASSFVANGTFLHPNFPGGVQGTLELEKFCSSNVVNAPYSTFRQDGPILLTPSGGYYVCLSPYVYASSNPDLSIFINSGFEALTLVRGPASTSSSPQFLIYSATEFFSRSELPNPSFT